MTSNIVTVPKTRGEVRAWLENSHAVHDSIDISTLNRIYSEASTLRIPGQPLLEGLDAIKSHFGPAFQLLRSMKHVLRDFDIVENRVWHTAQITYRVKNDPLDEEVVIFASAFATFVSEGEEAGKLASLELYMDNKPLAEKMGAVMKATAEADDPMI